MKNHWMKAKWTGLITVLMVFLSGCGKNHLSALRPAGEVGQEQFNLMILSIIIMLLVVVVVTVLFTIAVAKTAVVRRVKICAEGRGDKPHFGNHLDFNPNHFTYYFDSPYSVSGI